MKTQNTTTASMHPRNAASTSKSFVYVFPSSQAKKPTDMRRLDDGFDVLLRQLESTRKRSGNDAQNSVTEDAELTDFLQHQIVDLLEKQVEKDVEGEIARLVASQPAKRLDIRIPAGKDLTKQRRELEGLIWQLHNSQSRRVNARLKPSDTTGKLSPMYRTNGYVSELFPKSLQELFSLQGPACRTLIREYDLGEPSPTRDKNLSRFMQFCGIAVYETV